MGIIFDGKKEANGLISNMLEKASSVSSFLGRAPKLVVITLEESKEGKLFISQKKKVADLIGVSFEEIVVKKRETVPNILKMLNNEDSVDGYFFQLPVKYFDPSWWKDIAISKDVEGLGSESLGRLISGTQLVIPPTARAAFHVLGKAYGKNLGISDLHGKNVCVISSSRLIGIPLFHLFIQKGATVSVCHKFTKDIKKYTSIADIVVSGAGVPGLIKSEMIKEDAIVIDFGTKLLRKGKGSYTIKGDVDTLEVSKKARVVTPPRGGIGPVVVAYLFQNLLKLVEFNIR